MNKQLLDKIKQLAKEAKARFGQPLSLEEIQEMERKLQLRLPEEYKEFLREFGSIGGFGLEVYGSVPPPRRTESFSALGRTLDLRRSYPRFPKNCVALEYDGGDGYHCLVCEGKDYGRVIYWDMWCDPEQAYPNIPKPEWFEKNPDWARGAPEKGIPPHPTGKKEDFWVEALNFWDWLIKRLEQTKIRRKLIKEEEEKKRK